jgi:septin 7
MFRCPVDYFILKMQFVLFQVLNQIAQNKIKIYEFPDCDDEEENKINKQMRERVPFAVVGSNTVVEVDGKKARGRKYPWGTVLGKRLA